MKIRTLPVAASLALLAGCASTTPPPAVMIPPAVLALKPPSPDVDPVQQFHALLDAEWQRTIRESPENASYVGDHRSDDRWDDRSLDAIRASHDGDVAALKALLEIDRERLPPADQLNHDLFKRELNRKIEGDRYHAYFQPVNQLGGVQSADQLSEILPFATTQDYENWLKRLQSVDRMVDQTIALMQAGVAEGRTPPKVILSRVPAQIDKQLVKKPEDSLFYAPFKRFPAAVPAEDQARLAADARKAVTNVVLPSYQRFRSYFVNEYLPKCRNAIGLSEAPDGRDEYAYRARSYTTTNLTADEIHALGLREVERIKGEMNRIRAATRFKGDQKAFFAYLRHDRRFYHRDAKELLQSYRDIAKRIDPELPRLFGKLPRQPYGVREVPAATAPDAPTAYYQPGAADGSRAGWFYANTYKPETRPSWEQEALTAHESVPGHHLQLALQQEMGQMPDFRKQAGYTAFIEGWGLYAESLGDEIGLYRDPYSKFGQLSFEMWRAVRLVVDTGLHTQGWTRQQAIAFFKANTPRVELDIANEVDRYIAWPGQALAYKIGQLKISELRARAKDKLGAKFDLRAFHDVVLGSGALPLEILERNVDAWIAARADAS